MVSRAWPQAPPRLRIFRRKSNRSQVVGGKNTGRGRRRRRRIIMGAELNRMLPPLTQPPLLGLGDRVNAEAYNVIVQDWRK